MRIIYFDIDCLRPDHLGCYGYSRPTSPNIDAVAAKGTCFENYYCASSPCLPSRTALVSGRFGIRNGVVSNVGAGSDFKFRKTAYAGPQEGNEFFPRHLRRNNFDTFCISNFADRHCSYYFMAGWNEYITPNLKRGTETSEEVNEAALRWLKNNVDRDNYYLHINYWDTHRLYNIDPSWADRFKDSPVPCPWPDQETLDEHMKMEAPFTPNHLYQAWHTVPPLMPERIANRQDYERTITAYDACIAYVDHHIGIIIDFLKENNLYEDTAIIISADHGDAFGEHGVYTDHVCADECIHRVPLIVKWPGIALEGQKCNSLLYNVDFAPTVCDILGFQIPEDWDGESFKNHLEGKPGLEREYLVWDHALYTVQRAVRTKDYLMIHTYDDNGYDMDPVALYKISEDPYQTRNIAQDNPETVRACYGMMQEWIAAQQSKGNVIPDPLIKVLEERRNK